MNDIIKNLPNKFDLGDTVEKENGPFGEILMMRLNGNGWEYFIDPCPGADAGYEYIYLYNKIGKKDFIAGNWYDENELEIHNEIDT